MTVIRLRVNGVPYPQGSKSAYIRGGRAVLAEGSSKKGQSGHAAWRQAVATAARDYLDENPRPTISQPCSVVMRFRFSPVASDKYRTRHTVKPDLSKLVRATEDALVDGGLLHDDSYIWDMSAEKTYAANEPPGCLITITLNGAQEEDDREALKQAAKAARKGDKQGTLLG
jgi:crossover junction endodeoxyribonuclease RusA